MRNILFTITLLFCCIMNGQAKDKTTILCFGNSLTAGFGLPQEDAYPAQLQKKLQLTYKKEFHVINSGVSGELSVEGLKRLPAVLSKISSLDYFILELGVNDAIQKKNIPAVKANLLQIIHLVKTKFPSCKIILAEVKLKGLIETNYAVQFETMYFDIASTTKITHLQSFMEGVSGNTKYTLDDGLHPNEAGSIVMMENVFKVLQSIMK